MSGLTNLLNIGKVGLIAQQTSLQTIGHNISNVNTPGYSRQDVILSAKDPTPSFIGPMGNGVEATDITRAYDRFITATLFSKTSDLSGLETRLSGLKTIESFFNEVEENGLNGLLEDFWQGWDELANNAEGSAERTTLLQRATVLAQSIRDKYDNLMKLSKDVNLNIQSNIDDINEITQQISELNVQIVAAESGHHSANDLRDQRDELVRQLSSLVNIKYFETSRGSYTIMVGQGTPLVEDDRSWRLELLNDQVTWLGSNGQKFELTTQDLTSGELGGWLDIKEKLKPRDPTELTNSQVNTTGGGPIHLDTLFTDIDGVNVTGNFTISFSGTDQDGNPISTSFSGDASSTIRDFATAIENAFNGRVEVSTTEDGRIKIKDIDPGVYPISFQIDDISGSITGLNLGKFDNNYPLSYTEKLNLIAKELIKEVNGLHAQGVGLLPLEEATANNRVLNSGEALASRASGLEFSDDIETGSFQIWLYDSSGNVLDQDASTDYINDPVTISIDQDTTLDDLISQIDNISGLTASQINGHLVIGIEGNNDVAGFAFGKDTSNVLMALGINGFFSGSGANDIEVNSELINDPRLIAAAKIDPGGVKSAAGTRQVPDAARPLGYGIDSGDIEIQLQDPDGNTVASKTITIDRDETSLQDILQQMSQIDGVRAYVEAGKVYVEAERDGYEVVINDDVSGTDTYFLDYLGLSSPTFSGDQLESVWKVDRTFDPVASYDTGVVDDSFTLELRDADNQSLGTVTISLSTDAQGRVIESLQDVADAINSQSNLTARVVDDRLEISAEGGAERFIIANDDTGLFDYIQLVTPPGGELSPANNENALQMRQLQYKPISELEDATINESYHGLVGTVGINTRTVELDHDFMRGAVNDLTARREDISGVSIDEELSDLLKYQHAYTAAAKLIKAADEMFLSLLQAKQ